MPNDHPHPPNHGQPPPGGLPSICDICGNARSTRKHAACSRARQQLKQEEWATYMANVAAKKAKGGRHAR